MTKLIVDTKKLKENAKKVLAITSDFKYKIAVTKGNGYGHSTKLATKAFVKAGFNMFGLARFSECLETYEVVKKDKKIKIFSLSVIEPEHIEECIDKGFIVPITSLEQIQLYIQNKTIKGLNVQIVLNTGMNRIGFNNKEFIAKAYDLLVRYKAKIVGIFSHIFENDDIALSTAQFDKFEELLEAIPN
jgi:alanine racemase